MEGLSNRYEVKRIDGKSDGNFTGIGSSRKETDSQYFVLRMGPKPPNKHTVKALEAYAESIGEDEPALARDLFKYLFSVKEKDNG